MAEPGKDVTMAMVMGKRGDYEMPDVSLKDLERDLDMMGRTYADMLGIDMFHELEDCCKDIIELNGKAIEHLEVPQQLFMMCYFACSWINSFIVSQHVSSSAMQNKLGLTDEDILAFVEENEDLTDLELIDKFVERFGR